MSATDLYYSVLQIVAVAYMPVCLLLFHQRRHRFPIQGWDPVAMMAAGAASFATSIAAASRQVEIGLVLSAASVSVDAMLLQAAVLYAKAALSRDRVGLARVQSRQTVAVCGGGAQQDAAVTLRYVRPDPGPNFRLQSKLDQIWLLRQILRPPAAVVVLALTLGLTLIAVLLLWSHYPVLRETAAYQCTTTPCLLLIGVISGQAVVVLTLVLVLVWGTQLLADPYGVRRGIQALLGANLVTWLLYVALAQSAWLTEFDPALQVLLIGQHAVFMLGIVWPLARSYRPIYQSFQVTNGTMLDMFLVTPRHFKAFRDYLESEFSVENLLFWRAALEYHMACVRMMTPWSSRLQSGHAELHLDQAHPDFSAADRLRTDALCIYQTYIADGSPCQINISSEVCTKLSTTVAGIAKGGSAVVLDPNLFEEARLEIVYLMSHDSLVRFRETLRGRRLWEQFLVGSRPSSTNPSKMSDSQSSVHVEL